MLDFAYKLNNYIYIQRNETKFQVKNYYLPQYKYKYDIEVILN